MSWRAKWQRRRQTGTCSWIWKRFKWRNLISSQINLKCFKQFADWQLCAASCERFPRPVHSAHDRHKLRAETNARAANFHCTRCWQTCDFHWLGNARKRVDWTTCCPLRNQSTHRVFRSKLGTLGKCRLFHNARGQPRRIPLFLAGGKYIWWFFFILILLGKKICFNLKIFILIFYIKIKKN